MKTPTRFSSENEYWMTLAGAEIVFELAFEDKSGDYDTTIKHLYKLANGKFAVVRECGCSCYSMSDAEVETYETEKAARAAYHALSI